MLFMNIPAAKKRDVHPCLMCFKFHSILSFKSQPPFEWIAWIYLLIEHFHVHFCSFRFDKIQRNQWNCSLDECIFTYFCYCCHWKMCVKNNTVFSLFVVCVCMCFFNIHFMSVSPKKRNGQPTSTQHFCMYCKYVAKKYEPFYAVIYSKCERDRALKGTRPKCKQLD